MQRNKIQKFITRASVQESLVLRLRIIHLDHNELEFLDFSNLDNL